MWWIYVVTMSLMVFTLIPYGLRILQGSINGYYWFGIWSDERYDYINFPSFDNYMTSDGEITWSFMIYTFQRVASPQYLTILADFFMIWAMMLIQDIPGLSFFAASIIPAFLFQVVFYNIWPFLNIPYIDFAKVFGIDTKEAI